MSAAACVLAGAFALLLGAGAAQAGDRLVSNTGHDQGQIQAINDVGQSFITGTNPDGYRLTRVDLRLVFLAGDAPTLSVSINSDSSGVPGSSLGTLTQQGSWPSLPDTVQFTASGDGIELDPNTTYWLVLDITANANGNAYIATTASDAEDSGSSEGWSIGNTLRTRGWTVNGLPWTGGFGSNSSLHMAIYGHERQPLEVSGSVLTVNLDRAIDRTDCPWLRAFSLTERGTRYPEAFTYLKCASNSLTFHLTTQGQHRPPLALGQTVTLNYDKTKARLCAPNHDPNDPHKGPGDGETCISEALTYADDGTEVPSFTREVSLLTPGPARVPKLSGTTVEARTLTISFDEALDEGSAPPGSAFRLKAYFRFRDGSRNCLTGCAVKGTGTARVSGDTVTVDLDSHIPGGRVEVEYHAPSDSPLRTSAGGAVPSYTGHSRIVTHAVTDTTPPTLQSAKVYTANPHDAWVILTFDEGLIGPPPLDSDFYVTVNGERRSTRYSSGIVFGRTARVLLDSPVSAGDAVKVGYTRRGYRVWDHWASLQDASFNEVENFSDVPVSVTGGPPVLVGAGADGTRLTATFNEPLDETSVPAPGDFHVTVGASRRNVAADGVAIDGATVVLTLASAVTSADTVTMRYTRGANPLRDLDGDAVSTFSDQAVTNDTEGPQFASAGVDGRTLTVIFDKTLDGTLVPAPGDFHVTVGSARRNVAAGGVAVDGAAVRLTLASAARKADTVKVRYTKGTNPLRSSGGSEVETFADQAVANTAGPAFVGAQVDGETITLTFDEALDETSVPERGDFFVVVGNDRRNVAAGGVAIDGATVRLTLSWPAAAGERVILLYSRYTNPLRDLDGNEVENFASTDHTVPNLTARPGGFWSAVLSVHWLGPTRRGCWGGTNVCTITLTDGSFTRAGTDYRVDNLEVDIGAHDYLRFELDKAIPQDWTLHVGNRSFAVADAVISGGDNNLATWSSAGLNWQVGDKVAVALSGPAADTGSTGPSFQSAEVDGKTLTLTFDGTLDARSVPAPGDFYVTAGGIRRHLAAGGVAIDGATVTLTLGLAVVQGETVTVRYKKGANPLRDPSRNEVAGFAHTDLPVTNVTALVLSKFWSADLTVKQFAGTTLGCSFAGAIQNAFCSVGLTDDTFTHAGTDYTVGALTLANGTLVLALTSEIPQDWTLHVGDETFSVADATRSESNTEATWASSGLTWSVGDTVAVALAAAGRPEGINLPPGFLSATISGNKLTIQFDEPLNEDSAPSGKSFTVGTPPLPDTSAQSGPGRRARSSLSSGNGPGGAVSGTGTASVDGSTLTVTLNRPVPPGQKVTVSYTPPDVNPVQDLAGEEAEGFSRQPATSALPAPAVTAVAVVSDAGGDDTYALGETIRVRVTFNQAVKVDTTDGTPRLNIRMDPRWGTFPAAYESGGGTAKLTFAYTVAEPNTAPPGIAVLENTLELNGGTIRSLSGTDAKLAHAGLGHDAKHKVNWRLAPSDVSAVAVVSDAGSDDTYALGETIRVRVTFDGTVNVDTTGGTPRLKIRMDPRWGTFWATYAGGDGTNALTFAYTVAEPNTSPPGIAVLANTLQANGGAIRLAATNANARLGHAGLGHDPAHKVNWRLSPPVATTPPGAPTGVTVSGASATDLSVSWTAPSDTGSAAIAGYELRWHAGASDPSDASDWTETGDVGADTRATIADLAPDTAYRVQVRARGDGKGPWSSSGAGRTQQAADTTPPAPESATVNWRTVTVTFDEDLVAVGAGAGLHFTLTVTGGGLQQHPVRATASGKTVTMQLGTGAPARAGRSYAIGYYGGGRLKDAAGNAVVKFSALAATNLTLPRVSVADAEASEGTDASMDFAVTLDAAPDAAVTVDYATADGTATAGADYTAASGTLTFAAGERSKTVSVAILDDSVDEGRETFTLGLSNAQGAVIEDGQATGTIINTDAIPKGWLARFGRTVAETHVDAVRERLGADRSPGLSGTFAGQPLPGQGALDGHRQAAGADGTGFVPGSPEESGFASLTSSPEGEMPALHALADPDPESGRTAAPDGIPEDGILALRSFLAGDEESETDPEVRALAADDILLGTSFIMTRDAGTGSSHGFWGRAGRSGFSGRDGDTDVDGEVTSVMLGTDWKRKGTQFGAILSRSQGAGTYVGASSGEIDVTLTALVPWAGREIGDGLSVWGAAGIGRGDMKVTPEGDEPMNAGIGWSMAAAGADGALAPGERLLGAGLRWHADALRTQTSSDAATGLVATTGATTRLRLGVTADWRQTLESGATLGPRLEAGLRHDSGDAETGFGLEIGGGIGFSDPASGLSMTVDGRTLALHEDGAFGSWGLSLGLSWDPRPETKRGWSMSAKQGFGGASSGGVDALLGPEGFPGLAGTEAEANWAVEAAYGTGRGNGMVGSPYGRASGSDGVDGLRLGYRIEPDAAHAADASLDVWAAPGTGGESHEAGAGLQWRW